MTPFRSVRSLGRAFLARSEAREVVWTTWEEEVDEDTGAKFYRRFTDSYDTRWERPWTPRDSLVRMEQERADERKAKG